MTDTAPRRYSQLAQLILSRVREFYREPEAVFWVYGFPLLLALSLGLAFRERPVERMTVDVQHTAAGESDAVAKMLAADERMKVSIQGEDDARNRLRTTRTSLIVVPLGEQGYRYVYDPNRPESVLARNAVDSVLLRATGGSNVPPVEDVTRSEPGARYIDFLIPGLLGMNLMGGGLFGAGFVIVDMRVRKLLKRFLATPMDRGQFLLSIGLSRAIFTIPEVVLLLGFGWLVFGVGVRGSLLDLLVLIVLGAGCFMGVGLLVACRAKTLEAVSGLMNLVMLPMWVLSGVFFSSENFPSEMQPFIQALPLTALNNALRAVMLEGSSLVSQWQEVAILLAWGGVSFFLALRWFRWK